MPCTSPCSLNCGSWNGKCICIVTKRCSNRNHESHSFTVRCFVALQCTCYIGIEQPGSGSFLDLMYLFWKFIWLTSFDRPIVVLNIRVSFVIKITDFRVVRLIKVYCLLPWILTSVKLYAFVLPLSVASAPTFVVFVPALYPQLSLSFFYHNADRWGIPCPVQFWSWTLLQYVQYQIADNRKWEHRIVKTINK